MGTLCLLASSQARVLYKRSRGCPISRIFCEKWVTRHLHDSRPREEILFSEHRKVKNENRSRPHRHRRCAPPAEATNAP